jgi:hypothetical protein
VLVLGLGSEVACEGDDEESLWQGPVGETAQVVSYGAQGAGGMMASNMNNVNIEIAWK